MAFSKYYEDNCELTFDRIFGNANVPSSFIEAVIREMKYFIETQMDT